MGRPSTNSGRLSIEIDPGLKVRASIAALRAGMTLSQLVERGLVLAMQEIRAKGKHKPPPEPEQLPLDKGE
jgi:hypothetical protein